MATVGEFRAPTVFDLNSAGWWLNGRKIHAESRIYFLAKVRKTRNFGENMDNLGFGALFG